MPQRNRNRREKESVREAVAAGGYHEIQNERVIDEAKENGELKTEPAGEALAQEIAN
jgi:hypothetical protein